ncbi:hypothetical protein [Xenophilus sp.]|uniref:hypothetical protein n=1 Tax=Xenophilus sp. TaxID=1873499 RepID=UPI0037DD2D0D
MVDRSTLEQQTPAAAGAPDSPALVAARDRLARLERFLAQDPGNAALLIDAFETALACREWERAQALMQQGRQRGADPLGWRMREGDFWLAQQRHDRARSVYDSLQVPDPAPPGLGDVLLHNLAYIDFQEGRHTQALQRLAPIMEAAEAAPPAHAAWPMLACLWLRVLHHDRQHDRALAWTRAHAAGQGTMPPVLGVASLIALDAGRLDEAQRWAAASMQASEAPPTEALVTLASIASYAGNGPQAVALASEAVRRAPAEGRAWSALGFAQLLAQALGPARSAFDKALEHMPSHVGTWHGLGWTQLLQGERDGALRSFESALALDRNFAESHGAVALVHVLDERRELAQQACEIALRLDRDNLSGRYAQALLAGEVQDAQGLQRLVRRLLGARAHAASGADLASWVQARAASAEDKQ